MPEQETVTRKIHRIDDNNTIISQVGIQLTSIILVAWLVLPLASGDAKQSVFLPNGKLLMNGLMSTSLTFLPSSARIFTAVEEHTQNSLPSPGIF